MRIKCRKLWAVTATLATAAGISLLSPSAATADEDSSNSGYGWVLKNGTTGETIKASAIEELIPDREDDEGNDTRLIDDPLAWSACFGPSLNANYPLANYKSVPRASGTVYLQCGPKGSKTYGWHHIQSRHQSDWQNRMDRIAAESGGGAIPWDDLMEAFTMMAVTGPESWTVEYDGKRCYTTPIHIMDMYDNYLFTIHPTIILSMNNNRVITSYPTTNQDCTRQAPWEL